MADKKKLMKTERWMSIRNFKKKQTIHIQLKRSDYVHVESDGDRLRREFCTALTQASAQLWSSSSVLSVVGDGENAANMDEDWLERNDHPLMNNVILTVLFKNVSGNDLKSCRLVCKEWHNLANPYARSRLIVTISNNSSQKNGIEEFLKLIKSNELGIPFGRFRLGSFSTTDGFGEEFLHLCGQIIKEIILDRTDVHMVEDISEILKKAPKLQSITLPKDMGSKDITEVKELFPGIAKPKLPFLKTLDVRSDNPVGRKKTCPTFYEDLIQVAENLSKLNLTSFPSETGLRILEVIGNLGRESSIKNLKLQFITYEHLELLAGMAEKGLRLEHLYLSFNLSEQLQLIPLFSQSLISMHIRCVLPSSKCEFLFQRMPELKQLKLEIYGKNHLSIGSEDFANIFPNIQKLHVSFFRGIKEFNNLFGEKYAAPCPSMESLVIKRFPIRLENLDRIIKMFPTLTMLECEINSEEGAAVVQKIWKDMPQLEGLNIYGNVQRAEDVDTLVTGIQVKDLFKDFYNSHNDTSTVEDQTRNILLKLEKVDGSGAIGNLTNLRSLRLRLTAKESGLFGRYLSDLSGYFFFRYLKNLQNLYIGNCDFSQRCAETLVKEMKLITWEFKSGSETVGLIIPSRLNPNNEYAFP